MDIGEGHDGGGGPRDARGDHASRVSCRQRPRFPGKRRFAHALGVEIERT